MALHSNILILSQMTDLGLIRTKDKKVCNPTIYAYTTIDITTNETVDPLSFKVSAFENPETVGYCRKSFKTYAEAKKCYEELIEEHHIKS